VTVRDRLDGDLGSMSLDEAMARFAKEVADRTVRQTFGSTAGLGESVRGWGIRPGRFARFFSGALLTPARRFIDTHSNWNY